MISCIVTTRNEAGVLPDLMSSLEKQSYKDFEVILVDNNSSDQTKEIAQKFGARIFNKGPERSVQRNFGVTKARGEYILILDADMVLESKVLGELAELSRKKNVAAVIPEKSFGEGFWAKCKAYEREFYLGEETIEAARYFDKKIFNKFKGYDISLTGPEDYELPLRMKKSGFKIGRIKSFILHNEKKFSPLKSAKKKFYYASHARAYLKKHPEMALAQGNLLFRPIFFKKWKKLVSNPLLAFGMFLLKAVEGVGALTGFLYGVLTQAGLRSIIRKG